MYSGELVSTDTSYPKPPVVAVQVVGLARVCTQRNVSLEPL